MPFHTHLIVWLFSVLYKFKRRLKSKNTIFYCNSSLRNHPKNEHSTETCKATPNNTQLHRALTSWDPFCQTFLAVSIGVENLQKRLPNLQIIKFTHHCFIQANWISSRFMNFISTSRESRPAIGHTKAYEVKRKFWFSFVPSQINKLKLAIYPIIWTDLTGIILTALSIA